MTNEVIGASETADLSEGIQELIKLNEQRAATYAMLSRLFRVEIDQPTLDRLRTMRFPANTGNARVDEGYKLLATYLSGALENGLTDLAIDYVHVFIGSGLDAYSAAYPFESVYTSPKRLMMQEARDEVLAVYRAAGLNKDDSWKDGEDHIALELAFEEILCTRAVNALKNGDEDEAFAIMLNQKNFLEDHLVSWFSMMSFDMKRIAKTDFYKGLAFITEGFLETDQEFLQDILGDGENKG